MNLRFFYVGVFLFLSQSPFVFAGSYFYIVSADDSTRQCVNYQLRNTEYDSKGKLIPTVQKNENLADEAVYQGIYPDELKIHFDQKIISFSLKKNQVLFRFTDRLLLPDRVFLKNSTPGFEIFSTIVNDSTHKGRLRSICVREQTNEVIYFTLK